MRADAVVDALVARTDEDEVLPAGEVAARAPGRTRSPPGSRRMRNAPEPRGATASSAAAMGSGRRTMPAPAAVRVVVDGAVPAEAPRRAGRGRAARPARAPGRGPGWTRRGAREDMPGKSVMTSMRSDVRPRWLASTPSPALGSERVRRRDGAREPGPGRRRRASPPRARAPTTTLRTAGTRTSPRGPPRDDVDLARPGPEDVAHRAQHLALGRARLETHDLVPVPRLGRQRHVRARPPGSAHGGLRPTSRSVSSRKRTSSPGLAGPVQSTVRGRIVALDVEDGAHARSAPARR